LLGTTPSWSWRKGDLRPRTHHERKFSRWSLVSRLEHSHSLEEHIKDVLDQFDQNPNGFAKVSEEYGGIMQLVGYFHEIYPGFHFEPNTLIRLAKYSVAVDFDFYYLFSDAREDCD
jgi:hypothetical protein